MRQKWKDSRNRFVAPPRPKGIFDEEYQRVQSKIQELQTTQPKSIRKANEIRVEIQTLQNECNRLQERIVALDKLWTDSQWIESVAPASERLTWF
jgi:chromosome segregation ATPase